MGANSCCTQGIEGLLLLTDGTMVLQHLNLSAALSLHGAAACPSPALPHPPDTPSCVPCRVTDQQQQPACSPCLALEDVPAAFGAGFEQGQQRPLPLSCAEERRPACPAGLNSTSSSSLGGNCSISIVQQQDSSGGDDGALAAAPEAAPLDAPIPAGGTAGLACTA